MSTISLKIDDATVRVPEGSTVLEAAREAGIKIPTLCAHPDLEPHGSCRLCVVQVEGVRGFPTSCTIPAAQDMVVRTQTPEVLELRKGVLKLMLSGHTSPCLVCLHREPCEKYRPNPTKAGKATRCTFCSRRATCELRELAEELEITDLELPMIYQNLGLERLDPFMDRDYNLCVLCGRCVRICKSIHGKAAIDYTGRGEETKVGTVFHRDHTDSGCSFCGACIDICPTGALTDRFAKWHAAPDRVDLSTCTLCSVGCALKLKIKGGKVIATEATALTREARICAIGRFVLPQLLENPARLTSHVIRVPDGQRKASYDEAVALAAQRLASFSGPAFALIAHAAATREERHVLRRFTREVMKSEQFIVAEPGGAAAPAPGTTALFTTGDFVDAARLQELELTVVADLFPSAATEAAEVTFAAAALAETDGTFLAADGEARVFTASAAPPAGLVPDWKIVCDIACAMGAAGFDYPSTAAITEQLTVEPPPAPPDPSPLDEISALPRSYRGHRLAEISCALKTLLREDDAPAKAPPPAELPGDDDRPFKIVEKEEIVPNTHLITIHAPNVSRNCQPGQFLIAMADEKSERIPYSVADWDRAAGTVTVIVQEAGRSSMELTQLRLGDHVAHVTGPLGLSIEVKKYGTVVCGGGCYGVGAILPLARALRAAGNRVICVEEASADYLLHWRRELAEASDELVIMTKDGSEGTKGGVQEAIDALVERGETIDQAFIIGCTFMMMLVCEATKRHEIPTQTALNPIMLDGTGMCGACRVTVGGATKFTCVDGPFLDGHKIDWIELLQRRSAFGKEEKEALPQDHRNHSNHPCHSI